MAYILCTLHSKSYWSIKWNISYIIKHASELLKSNPTIEIILVNNGSTDNSKDILRNEKNYYKSLNIKIINIDKNKGYGGGILRGLSEASGDFLAWTHADMQTDPNDVLLAYNKIIESSNPENTFLKGKRKKRNIV